MKTSNFFFVVLLAATTSVTASPCPKHLSVTTDAVISIVTNKKTDQPNHFTRSDRPLESRRRPYVTSPLYEVPGLEEILTAYSSIVTGFIATEGRGSIVVQTLERDNVVVAVRMSTNFIDLKKEHRDQMKMQTVRTIIRELVPTTSDIGTWVEDAFEESLRLQTQTENAKSAVQKTFGCVRVAVFNFQGGEDTHELGIYILANEK